MAEDNAGFLDRFAETAARIGNQIHLRSLRDAFATIMPLYILAGIAVLVNNVMFPWFLSGDTLKNVQTWGTALTNGTLNFSAVIIAGLIGYCLAKNRRFENPIAAVVVSLSALIVMMPFSISATLSSDSASTADVTNALLFTNTGVSGLFGGIIIGLLATELFIRLSGIEGLRVKLGEGIPPAVGSSFDVLIPMLITLAVFGVVDSVLFVCFGTDLIALIKIWIQTPLKALGTSLPAVVLIYSLGNFLFTLGIHQTVVNGVLLEPIMTIAVTENMQAAASGQAIPNILNMDVLNNFAMMGGTGCTICLIIATLIFSRNKVTRSVIKLATLPGLFNINEPIIFGYPIVFNIPMMIPFVGIPALNIVITYFATALGLVSPCVAYVPWTTPPIISGFLATGGDVRASILQIALIALGVIIYLPFMKISERVMSRQAAEGELAED